MNAENKEPAIKLKVCFIAGSGKKESKNDIIRNQMLFINFSTCCSAAPTAVASSLYLQALK